MKTRFTIFFLLIWCVQYAQPCLPEGITFKTQTQVNDFPSDYPGCTQILGSVTIEDTIYTHITYLDSLHTLTSIGGDLSILSNKFLHNLSGLNNITFVGGDLLVDDNLGLITLSGLENLTTIGSDLTIINNKKLTGLNALQNVGSIGKNIYVIGTSELTSFSGLENITSIEGNLLIGYNDALTSLHGLENINSIAGKLQIFRNEDLTSFSGLNNVHYIGVSCYVTENDALINFSGLDNLISIGEDLYVRFNNALINFNGLNKVNSTGGFIILLGNPSLTSLTGLENVTSINGYILIKNNDALTGLAGLEAIEPSSIAWLYLEQSSNLSTCAVKSICDYLDNGGPATIFGNATGCNSVEEVQAACEALPAIEATGENDEIELSPNPTTGMIEITGGESGQKYSIVKVTDITGRVVPVKEFDENSRVYLTGQPNGMYFITIQIGSRILVKRVIKE